MLLYKIKNFLLKNKKQTHLIPNKPARYIAEQINLSLSKLFKFKYASFLFDEEDILEMFSKNTDITIKIFCDKFNIANKIQIFGNQKDVIDIFCACLDVLYIHHTQAMYLFHELLEQKELLVYNDDHSFQVYLKYDNVCEIKVMR